MLAIVQYVKAVIGEIPLAIAKGIPPLSSIKGKILKMIEAGRGYLTVIAVSKGCIFIFHYLEKLGDLLL